MAYIQSSLMDSILFVEDVGYLTSLITDDLFQNYRNYIRSDISTSSYDYALLSNKITYDGYNNNVTKAIASNIETTTTKTKSIVTYVYQYNLVDNVNIYSYRKTLESNSLVASASATSSIMPAFFTTSSGTVDNTQTVHVLKTTLTKNFVPTVREDFINMPLVFASPNSIVKPAIDSTYYSLRTMLINYYSSKASMGLPLIGNYVSGIAIVVCTLSLWLLTYVYTFSAFSWIYTIAIFLLCFIPMVVNLLLPLPINTTQIIYYINKLDLLNIYQTLSGGVGIIMSIVLLIQTSIASM